ncbi:MAG: HDOD domain-containing protein [Bryobacterales bacterium]
MAPSQMLVPLEPDPARVREAVWRLEGLPAISPAIQQALAMCGDPLCSNRDLERVLAADQALVAQILKIANSAYYAAEGRAATISRAVTVIGHEKLQSLLLQIMLAGAFRRLSRRHPEGHRIVAVSVAAAAACYAIAEYVPGQDSEELLVAGLLHNLGDLVLMTAFSSEYQSACQLAATMSDSAAQRAIFGVDAQLTGRWLLEAWGLPLQFAESAQHWPDPLHAELQVSSRAFLCVVHLGVHVGRCWGRERNWQEAERLADPKVFEELSLGVDDLQDIYEELSEHVGRVQILLE